MAVVAITLMAVIAASVVAAALVPVTTAAAVRLLRLWLLLGLGLRCGMVLLRWRSLRMRLLLRHRVHFSAWILHVLGLRLRLRPVLRTGNFHARLRLRLRLWT